MMQPQEDYWNDDDDNVVVPLVDNDNDSSGMDSALRKRRQRKQRLKSLEIAMRQQEDDAYYPTCLGDSWRLLASVLLGCIMVAPLVLKYYRSSNITTWPSDDLPCAQDLQISYSHTYDKIYKATAYCSETKPLCNCTSPFIPKFAADDSRKEQWGKAFDRNIGLAKTTSNSNVDVVLLGDSITEHWQGKSMGRPKYPDIHRVYEDLFQNKQKTGIDGLALGISGDRVSWHMLCCSSLGSMTDENNESLLY